MACVGTSNASMHYELGIKTGVAACNIRGGNIHDAVPRTITSGAWDVGNFPRFLSTILIK